MNTLTQDDIFSDPLSPHQLRRSLEGWAIKGIDLRVEFFTWSRQVLGQVQGPVERQVRNQLINRLREHLNNQQ